MNNPRTNWRIDTCPVCRRVAIGRTRAMDERTCGYHWWKWNYNRKYILSDGQSTQYIGGHMFEYLRLDMNDGSHPIQWEQLGREGWELVTIHKDVAYFKRVVDVGVSIFQSTDGQVTITPLPGK